MKKLENAKLLNIRGRGLVAVIEDMYAYDFDYSDTLVINGKRYMIKGKECNKTLDGRLKKGVGLLVKEVD